MSKKSENHRKLKSEHKNTINPEDNIFITKSSTLKSWANEADRLEMEGSYGKPTQFSLPPIFQALKSEGLKLSPTLAIDSKVYDKITGKADIREDGSHQLSKDQVKMLYQGLSDPAAIYYSHTDGGYVAVTGMRDKNQEPVVVSLHTNKRLNGDSVTTIASAYGKSNTKRALEQAKKSGDIIYANPLKTVPGISAGFMTWLAKGQQKKGIHPLISTKKELFLDKIDGRLAFKEKLEQKGRPYASFEIAKIYKRNQPIKKVEKKGLESLRLDANNDNIKHAFYTKALSRGKFLAEHELDELIFKKSFKSENISGTISQTNELFIDGVKQNVAKIKNPSDHKQKLYMPDYPSQRREALEQRVYNQKLMRHTVSQGWFSEDSGFYKNTDDNMKTISRLEERLSNRYANLNPEGVVIDDNVLDFQREKIFLNKLEGKRNSLDNQLKASAVKFKDAFVTKNGNKDVFSEMAKTILDPSNKLSLNEIMNSSKVKLNVKSRVDDSPVIQRSFDFDKNAINTMSKSMLHLAPTVVGFEVFDKEKFISDHLEPRDDFRPTIELASEEIEVYSQAVKHVRKNAANLDLHGKENKDILFSPTTQINAKGKIEPGEGAYHSLDDEGAVKTAFKTGNFTLIDGKGLNLEKLKKNSRIYITSDIPSASITSSALFDSEKNLDDVVINVFDDRNTIPVLNGLDKYSKKLDVTVIGDNPSVNNYIEQNLKEVKVVNRDLWEDYSQLSKDGGPSNALKDIRESITNEQSLSDQRQAVLKEQVDKGLVSTLKQYDNDSNNKNLESITPKKEHNPTNKPKI